MRFILSFCYRDDNATYHFIVEHPDGRFAHEDAIRVFLEGGCGRLPVEIQGILRQIPEGAITVTLIESMGVVKLTGPEELIIGKSIKLPPYPDVRGQAVIDTAIAILQEREYLAHHSAAEVATHIQETLAAFEEVSPSQIYQYAQDWLNRNQPAEDICDPPA